MTKGMRQLLIVAAIVAAVWFFFIRPQPKKAWTQPSSWPSEVNREVQH